MARPTGRRRQRARMQRVDGEDVCGQLVAMQGRRRACDGSRCLEEKGMRNRGAHGGIGALREPGHHHPDADVPAIRTLTPPSIDGTVSGFVRGVDGRILEVHRFRGRGVECADESCTPASRSIRRRSGLGVDCALASLAIASRAIAQMICERAAVTGPGRRQRAAGGAGLRARLPSAIPGDRGARFPADRGGRRSASS